MFTLKSAFRKAKQLIETPRDVNEVIAEIHNEFDTSTERLLNKAKEIIGKGDKIKINKAERLKAIGFNNSAPVVQTQKQVEEEKESERVAELIMYYRQWYPNNKFITEKEVENICKKYGLIFAETKYYIGDIPLKNLEEIEKFYLRQEDKIKRTNVDDWFDNRRASMMLQAQATALSSLSGIPRGIQSSLPSYDSMPTVTAERFIQPSYKICASNKDFDTRYMRIEDGYKLENIPDPIVLQPVSGGYLIVSKWGLEASDEIVVNEKMN